MIKDSFPDIGDPNLEQLGFDVMFKKVDIGDNVEHGAFVHPFRERDNFSASINFVVLPGSIQVDMDYPMHTDCVVIIQSELFLVFPFV